MANESKVNVTESKAAEKKLLVSREIFGKSKDEDQDLYSYFIEATFIGQKQRISLKAEDSGMFSLLNIIYGESNVAEGRIVESEFKADENSEPIKTLSVEVFVKDEDGIEIMAPLKCQRKSDKTCLAIVQKQLKARKVNK